MVTIPTGWIEASTHTKLNSTQNNKKVSKKFFKKKFITKQQKVTKKR